MNHRSEVKTTTLRVTASSPLSFRACHKQQMPQHQALQRLRVVMTLEQACPLEYFCVFCVFFVLLFFCFLFFFFFFVFRCVLHRCQNQEIRCCLFCFFFIRLRVVTYNRVLCASVWFLCVLVGGFVLGL